MQVCRKAINLNNDYTGRILYLEPPILANCLIKLCIYFIEIHSSVTGLREENKMDVCCLFKSLVSWWAALVFL